MAQKPRWWRARIVCNEIRWVLRVPTTHHRFGLLRRRNCRLYWLQFSTRVSPNVPTTAALHIRDWQFNIVDSIHIRIDYGVAGFLCRRQYNAGALLSGGSGSVLVVVSSIASAPAFRSGNLKSVEFINRIHILHLQFFSNRSAFMWWCSWRFCKLWSKCWSSFRFWSSLSVWHFTFSCRR